MKNNYHHHDSIRTIIQLSKQLQIYFSVQSGTHGSEDGGVGQNVAWTAGRFRPLWPVRHVSGSHKRTFLIPIPVPHPNLQSSPNHIWLCCFFFFFFFKLNIFARKLNYGKHFFYKNLWDQSVRSAQSVHLLLKAPHPTPHNLKY